MRVTIYSKRLKSQMRVKTKWFFFFLMSALGKQGQVDLCEFQASVVYIANFGWYSTIAYIQKF